MTSAFDKLCDAEIVRDNAREMVVLPAPLGPPMRITVGVSAIVAKIPKINPSQSSASSFSGTYVSVT